MDDFDCDANGPIVALSFQGLIQEISLLVPGQEPIPVVSNLVGKPYMEDCFHGILDAMKGASTENMKHAMGL